MEVKYILRSTIPIPLTSKLGINRLSNGSDLWIVRTPINDSHTVVRHIRKNYGIGANADIIPNLYPSDYLHTGSIYTLSPMDGGSRSLTIRQMYSIRSSPVEKSRNFHR